MDVGLVVLAPRGESLSLGFLDRALVALESGGIEPTVVVTKMDLVPDGRAVHVKRLLSPWEHRGIDVHFVASLAGTGIQGLRDSLAGRAAVVLGHSGVGKSTLINALDPAAAQTTGAVREVDRRGRPHNHVESAAALCGRCAGRHTWDPNPGAIHGRDRLPHRVDP